jgi:tetratricopeptide (TPR) repeat protein
LSPIKKPSDGLAEAYFNISGWFYENKLYKFSAYFANIGLKLRPDHQPLNYLLLNIYQKLSLDNLVLKFSNNIKESDLYYLKSSKVVIKSLNTLEENEKITEYVKKLIIRFPENRELKLILADNLRQIGKHKESIEYYNDIISEIEVFKVDHWSIFYARGISYERLKEWKYSDKDLLKALELKPDSAYVMNYLGYSWLERNIKLNQALDLIISANKLEPEDAFITDSLGWAYYLLGKYKESITILEKAISILPFDPTLNDHLGDAYWKVGRKKEAYSQWKKVLVYDPEFEKRKKVRYKITFGL